MTHRKRGSMEGKGGKWTPEGGNEKTGAEMGLKKTGTKDNRKDMIEETGSAEDRSAEMEETETLLARGSVGCVAVSLMSGSASLLKV